MAFLRGAMWLTFAVSMYATGSLFTLSSDKAYAAGSIVVTVDFGSIKGPATHRASGFLNTISADLPADQPEDQLIRLLRPKLFRLHAREALTPAIYRRLTGYGADIQSVISDAYGYPGPSGIWPGDGGDWTKWEHLVEELVREADAKGFQLLWDIWNEPDHNQFWDRGAEQFFETWKRAVITIRRVDPTAIIVGPSLANGPWHYLYGFLLSARKENVLPDIISWHDMSLDHPDDVSDVRQFMAKQGIPPRPISINEFQYFKGKHRPGLTVWWLAHMETEAPESAAYSCWPDPAGYSDCDSPTLDGLLTRDGKPRAVWFAHKGYADITGLLVEVGVSEAGIAGIAGANEAVQTARLILGRREISHGSEGTEVEVVFRNMDLVSYLGEEGKVFVRAARIPNSGTASLEGYEVAMADECLVRDNEVRVRLRDFGAWEAYTVVLGREARSDSEWHSINREFPHASCIERKDVER